MTFPHRHQSYAHMHKWVSRRQFLLGRDALPTKEDWNALGDGLVVGDAFADELVEWMHGYGMKQAHALFRRALSGGIESLESKEKDDAPALLAFFEEVEREPDWLDWDRVQLGGEVIDRCHPVPFYVLRNAGLMSGYLLSDLNLPLLMTGALRGGTRRRVAQTMKWFSDCSNPEGLRRGGDGFKSTVHVRLLHALVRRRLRGDKEWDSEDMGLPINQTDMVATWLAFSVVFLAGARLMGVVFTKKEAEAVMHLWKYACWLMGIEEKWLTDHEKEGRVLLAHVLGSFRGANESSYELGKALRSEASAIPYPFLQPLQWRVEQAKHLSVTMLFVGPKGMKALGLPPWVPPWYPLLSFVWNVPRSVLLRVLPQLKTRVEKRGRQERKELVQLHFGDAAPDLASTER